MGKPKKSINVKNRGNNFNITNSIYLDIRMITTVIRFFISDLFRLFRYHVFMCIFSIVLNLEEGVQGFRI